ncbi:carboxypeptidase-like regulatory domain-containing protein [Fibrella sp. WM1]|uniref:carboxypeptidase-like regulatory domain-containing protein n=1 Tax=Fibrella musci TaxID=3242485 RepID=UPI003520CA21
MKIIVNLLLVAGLLNAAACKQSGDTVSPSTTSAEKGVVKGRVVDGQGQPVANAQIIANSTDYYNKTTTAYTDANGVYRMQLPTGVAEGSYSASGTVTIKYHGKNFKMALYEENTRVFSAYDGAVRNFVFRLTGKRTANDDDTAKPLGGSVQVHHQVDNVVWENLELTLQPVGPLVDGSTGQTIIRTMPAHDNYLRDIPVGQYAITARDKVTGKRLGVTIKDSFKDYTSSVTTLFSEENFDGDTFWEIVLLVNTL